MINFPTVLTISRFIFAIFVSVLLFFDSNDAVIIALILFILGSLSDALDGAFARRRSSESQFGAFLDPIADKFLVFLVLISLVYQRGSIIVFVITILIISREVFIMSLREWMANSLNGKTLEVSSLAKTKTIVQMLGISMVIATPIIHLSYYFELSIVVLIIGTLFGYFSAYKYYKESDKAIFIK
jgi:CDP-diacylglycerol--glycerol-3-phosphate 3-phosphatidyltransferase